jgi:ribosomal protein S18 acetylase RimI-like enzyme
MEIRSLAATDPDTIFRAFEKSFADYEVQINRQQFMAMIKRRGFDPALSFAAFENGEILSFTLNGKGTFNGISTAYDTGTGTLPDHRGKGLATKIFEYSIPFLKKDNIKQYLLEVLQHNTKAVSVYRKLGFEVTREFNYFVQKNEKINAETKNIDPVYRVRQIDTELVVSLDAFRDFYPSWQNSFESIRRVPRDLITLGAYKVERLCGYCILEPAGGDVAQIAVERENRQKGIGSLMLYEAIQLNKSRIIKVINTDISCTSVTGFLKSKNMGITGKQYEMIRTL